MKRRVLLDVVQVFFRLVRAAAFFVIAILLIQSAGTMLRADDETILTTEHRLTSLETRYDYLAAMIDDLKKYVFSGLVGFAGLCGEAGVRLVRKKLPAE